MKQPSVSKPVGRPLFEPLEPRHLLSVDPYGYASYGAVESAAEERPFDVGTAGISTSGMPSYSVVDVTVGGAVEHRLYLDGRHFLTVIEDAGVFVVRPHPGVDLNGWGSSWYMQPFLPGAVLGHSAVNGMVTQANHIDVTASGLVSKGANDTFGTWTFAFAMQYDPAAKEISGSGRYEIVLDGTLGSATGDLNLFKIASNYLDDVPLLSGGFGDTGDMRFATVTGGGFQFDWYPPLQPAHYPSNETDSLSVEVRGQLNAVDTVAQGYAPIEPAYKPSMGVALVSDAPGVPMIFGGQYDLGHAQDFWADNVGITPLVLVKSTLTYYAFDVTFHSSALKQDGVDINRDGKVDGYDLAIWRRNYDPLGANADTPAMGDCNGDGVIDGADLALWQQNYNPHGLFLMSESANATSIPESREVLPPASSAMVESTGTLVTAAGEEDQSLTATSNESEPTALSQPEGIAADAADILSLEPLLDTSLSVIACQSVPRSMIPRQLATASRGSLDVVQDLLAHRSGATAFSINPISPSVLGNGGGPAAAETQTPSSSLRVAAYHRRSLACSLAGNDDAVDLLALTELTVPLGV